MQRFTDHLRALAEPIWQAQHEHPFVRGIGDGSLDRKRFTYWVRQDYLYLIEYARSFGIAAARAPDLATMARFADLLQATARVETGLHRTLAGELGISEDELAREEMSPTTRGYTDFLLRVAAIGDYAELVAAVLPCMWGFAEIGQALKARGLPADVSYARWIETYADEGFAALAEWCRNLLDRLVEGMPADQRRRIEAAFLTSSRYEHRFWEAAETMEQWPV
ncbi:MAG: thiaminase II [Chloroflexi bacterium]|nr:thiaminase II [Chloroflexota bacterium]